MNKKKLVISILVVIMVLSLALTALVGCKPDDDGKETGDYVELPATTSLSTVLTEPLYNTAANNLVNNLKASAQLKLDTKYGESTSSYTIKFGVNLALNTADNNKNSIGLSIVDSKDGANTNILNAYYDENTSNRLYVDLGNGSTAKHLALKAVGVKSTLSSENATVTNEQASAIKTTVTDGVQSVFDILNIVAGMGTLSQAKNNSEVMLSLDISKVLDDAADVLGIIDQYTSDLGLALNSTNLKSTLPDLKLNLHFLMDGATATNYDDAVITGLKVDLEAGSKDMVIKRTDTEQSTFFQLNIAKDFTANVDLRFAFGDDVASGHIPTPRAQASEYKQINAIDFAAEGELKLNEAIGVSIQLGNDPVEIAVPAGTYTIKLAVDIDPTQLIGMSFNAVGTQGILDLVDGIATNVLKKLSIDIADKSNPSDTTKQLKVSIANGTVNLNNLSLIGGLGTAISGLISDGMSITQVLNVVKTFLPADSTGSGDVSGEPSGDAGSGEAASGSGETVSGAPFDMTPIADLIKNMTILINGGVNVTVNNHTVAKNEGKADTTIDATAVANGDGVQIDATVKNIIINGNAANISAQIKADNTGVTITAKSATTLTGTAEELKFTDTMGMKIDLVLKLTKFTLGGANN